MNDQTFLHDDSLPHVQPALEVEKSLQGVARNCVPQALRFVHHWVVFFGCSKRLVFLGTQNAQEGEAEANSFKWHPSSSFDFVMSQNLSYQVLMIALYNLNTSWYRFQLPTGLSILETRFSTTSFGSAPSCFSQPNRIWHRLCWPLVLYSLVAIAPAVKCRFNAGNETTAVELHNATNATTVSWLCKHENLLEFF